MWDGRDIIINSTSSFGIVKLCAQTKVRCMHIQEHEYVNQSNTLLHLFCCVYFYNQNPLAENQQSVVWKVPPVADFYL